MSCHDDPRENPDGGIMYSGSDRMHGSSDDDGPLPDILYTTRSKYDQATLRAVRDALRKIRKPYDLRADPDSSSAWVAINLALIQFEEGGKFEVSDE